MALTFPSSPTNGQYYTDSVTGNRYVYNAASGVWTFAANNVGMSISSTPPANVASGALWYNREIGRTFVYYDDGDSKQWVETVPATGFFDSSTVAGYANAATQIYLSPVYTNANAAFAVANAAYGAANNVGPQIAPAFNTANAVYNQSNVVFGTVNASFGKSNTALQNTSGTFAGNLSVTGNGDFSLGTSHLKLPIGTTGQRPVGVDGMIRFNSTLGYLEYYSSPISSWVAVADYPTYSIEFLIVAGGGSGAGGTSGGGGAGGAIDSSTTVTRGTSYSLVIGAGGASVTQTLIGNNGSNSTGFGQTAIGGGRGGGTYAPSVLAAGSGGSGGGGGQYSGYSASAGAGTAGQGNAGGASGTDVTQGGGGGATQAGSAGSASTSGNGGKGGDGINWKSLGTYYAGGGGGSCGNNAGQSGGAGGLGGGGTGMTNNTGVTSGSTNTGGGGGGAWNYTNPGSGAGGSGIIIVRYQSATQIGSGGTVTSSGGYYYHTFTSSGTFIA